MFKQKLFSIYIFIRTLFNPYIPPKEAIWDKLKELSIQEFSEKINTVIYRQDPLWGMLDYTGSMKGFFNPKKKYNKDCDNFARAWFTYGVLNDMNCFEMMVDTEEHYFKDSHAVCILENSNGYWLCNYKPYGPYPTFELALDSLERWERYSDGFIYAHSVTKMFSEV